MIVKRLLTLKTVTAVYQPASSSRTVSRFWIAGSALRGALRAALSEISETSLLVCSPALPIADADRHLTSHPALRSTLACSSFSPDQPGSHGLYDAVLAHALHHRLAVEHGHSGDNLTAAPLTCPRCERHRTSLLCPWSGLIVRRNDQCFPYTPQFDLIVSREPSSSKLLAGTIRERTLLSAGQFFECEVTFASADLAQEATMTSLPPGRHLWIGGDRTHGYGEVQIVDWKLPAQEPVLTERFHSFQALIQSPRQSIEDSAASLIHYIALSLSSPLLLRDAFGRDTLQLSRRHFSRWLAIPEESVTLVAAWEDRETVSGWHGRRSLPLSTRWAIATGSCWLLAVVTDETGYLLQQLTKLEALPLGDRTADGFGQFRAYDPSHRAGLALIRSWATEATPRKEDTKDG